jgi:hypothetical protein
MEKHDQFVNTDEYKNPIRSDKLITIAPKTATIIEFICGIFGFLGIGWMLANRTKKGLFLLIGYFLFRILVLASSINTVIELVLNLIPMIISSSYLNNENRKKTLECIQIPLIIAVILESIGGLFGMVGLGWLFANKNKQGIAILISYSILKYIYKVFITNPTSFWYALANFAIITTSILFLYKIGNNNLGQSEQKT